MVKINDYLSRMKKLFNNTNNNSKFYFRIKNKKGGHLTGYLTPPCHNMGLKQMNKIHK